MGMFDRMIDWLKGGDDEENPQDYPDFEDTVEVQVAVEELADPAAEVAAAEQVAVVEGRPADGYWWEKPAPVPGEFQTFAAMDLGDIFGAVADRLADGEITLIEIPGNITGIMALLDQSDFDYGQIAHQIEQSPALLGEFLRAANSAQYNRGSTITNIRLILPRLGRNATKSMLYLSTSKLALPSHELFKAVASEIIEHSMVVGRIAEYLSQRYFPDASKAFVGGLMHDIGKVAILKEISEGMELPDDIDVPFTEELFGEFFPGLHEDAGVLIAANWKLDDDIVDAIAHHHKSAFTSKGDDKTLEFSLPALINISDIFARMLGFGRPVGDVDIFNLSSAKTLRIEDNPTTRTFLQGIMELFDVVQEPQETPAE